MLGKCFSPSDAQSRMREFRSIRFDERREGFQTFALGGPELGIHALRRWKPCHIHTIYTP